MDANLCEVLSQVLYMFLKSRMTEAEGQQLLDLLHLLKNEPALLDTVCYMVLSMIQTLAAAQPYDGELWPSGDVSDHAAARARRWLALLAVCAKSAVY